MRICLLVDSQVNILEARGWKISLLESEPIEGKSFTGSISLESSNQISGSTHKSKVSPTHIHGVTNSIISVSFLNVKEQSSITRI